MRIAQILTLFSLAACTQSNVIVGPEDAAMTDASVDGASSSDAGVDATMPVDMRPMRPPGGGECDQQDDCDACGQCSIAPGGQCNGHALACEDNEACTALVDCTNGCGTQECVDACGTAHPTGVELFNSLLYCMACTACPADCFEARFNWCETEPL